jgi:hypothetical protein
LPERIRPQLTQLVQEAPEGPEWLHEIKFDGYRMHTRLDRGAVRLLTRTISAGLAGSAVIRGNRQGAGRDADDERIEEASPVVSQAQAQEGYADAAQEMIFSKWLAVIGLALTLVGAACGFYGVWIPSADQAIERGAARYSGGLREDQLKLPAVQNLISQSHYAMFGFALIGAGTLLQIAAVLVDRKRV